MHARRNPPGIHPPAGISAHAIEVAAGARTLYVSGQVAIRPDGTIPAGIEAQTEVVWDRIEAILAEAGMGIGDIVKLSSFLTSATDYAAFAAVRARRLAGHRCASTAVFVSGLVKPEMRVEIEVVAARAGVAIETPASRPR